MLQDLLHYHNAQSTIENTYLAKILSNGFKTFYLKGNKPIKGDINSTVASYKGAEEFFSQSSRAPPNTSFIMSESELPIFWGSYLDIDRKDASKLSQRLLAGKDIRITYLSGSQYAENRLFLNNLSPDRYSLQIRTIKG